MATHAPITGAPTRAPIILPFPDTPVSRARRGLTYVRNHSMLAKWTARVTRDPALSFEDRLDLACRSARRHLEISLAEG
ncbi:hypothetical protein GCM10011395_14100 [Sphingomonas psychrolutea]|uniref:Uncharacterized protein n=1 Tax=Sphingomonas psychrolutea TaxID=1259676 RepID=A0ABQ1GJV5_9SPHN|nr:hypothetical protein GCM10011395_14100 [Sphingomonas psychrolutea]